MTKRTQEYLLFGATLLDASRAAGIRRRTASRRAPSEGVWIRGDRIVAAGPLAALRARAGRGATRVDLGGGTLTPGFTDSHIHLVTWIRALREPWLTAQDGAAIEHAVAERTESAPSEEWLLVRGWVPRDWPLSRRTIATLDAIAPDRPLVLYAVDGHSVWANSVALSISGVNGRTANPPGGVVERNAADALTGAMIEEARKFITEKVERTNSTRDDLAAALAKARSLGITSAHDFDRAATWRAAGELEREGNLAFRLLVSIPVASLKSAEQVGLAAGFGGEHVRIGPVKMFADGTLGSATALLGEPYEGSTDRGMEVSPLPELAAACERALDAGLSVAIHAIGDAAVKNALDAIEEATRTGKRFPLPPRVEHVQLSKASDWPRFRILGAFASVQPVHQLTDREIAQRKWGTRCARAYAWKSLLAAGARLLFGSDAPFDRAGPLLALQAALLRREGPEAADLAFHPAQKLRLAQALRAHLEIPHLVAGWTLPLGRIAPGYGADLAHFDHDLSQLRPEEWHRVRAMGTWVGGEKVSIRATHR